MKRTLALLAFFASALPVIAGGPVFVPHDPVVTPPADASGDWTGLYAGVTGTRTSDASSRDECYKDYNGQLIPLPCDNDAFTEFGFVPVIKTISSGTSGVDVGAFVGYRHDFGRIVGGVEANTSGGQLQLGLDLNRVLAYGFAGTGGAYGAGLDVALGKRLLVGVQHDLGDEGATSLRVGIRF